MDYYSPYLYPLIFLQTSYVVHGKANLGIVLSFALVTAWSSMRCSEGELTRTHRKPSDTRYIEGSGGAVWLNAQPKVFPSEHAGAILQITENNR